MIRLLTSIGVFAIIAGLAGPVRSFAQEQSAYQQILTSVKQRHPEYEIEPAPLEYVTLRLQQTDETADVATAEGYLDGSYIEDCEYASCVQTANDVLADYSAVTDYREFSRQLQRIAYSYEAGNLGLTGHPQDLAQTWPSISSIWQSGVDASLSPLPTNLVRYEQLDDSYDEYINAIVSAAEELIINTDDRENTDAFNAAVYRYRHGVADVLEVGSCEAHNESLAEEKTASFAMQKRYCALEQAMSDLVNALEDYEFEPPLRTSEQAIFGSHEIENRDAYLWIRDNDVGLNWIDGFDTAHSTFTDEEELVVANWEYETVLIEPKFGKGLCSHPIAKQGYLCRPLSADVCPVDPDNCIIDPNTGNCFDPETSGIDRSVIGLTTCEPQNFTEPVRITESGYNVCQIGGWLEAPTEEDGYDELSSVYLDTDPNENPDIADQKNECSNCVVDFYCSDSCGTMGANGGYTFVKDDDHVTKVCLPNNLASYDNALIYYVGLHEAVHAQQICGLPPDSNVFETQAQCCAKERDAYLVMCNALWEDGILQQTNYTVEECASVMSNNSCESFGPNACTVTETNSDELLGQVTEVLQNNRDSLTTPQTCQEVISEPTQNLQSLVYSTAPVCNPNCGVKYKNTIGNNLCYIGQCVEQSWEQNRLVPGRATTTVQAQAFPWEACMNPDPQLGTVSTNTTINATRLPAYNPAQLVQNLDRDLCKQNGYPMLTPPILCMYDQNQQLNLTQIEALAAVTQLEQNTIADAFERELTINSFSNIGNRLGSTLYNNYLDTAVLSMNEALKNIEELMQQMGEIELPTVMCPREPIQSCSYFTP